jgi:predicted Holliday junction resolvase-like endonuclease
MKIELIIILALIFLVSILIVRITENTLTIVNLKKRLAISDQQCTNLLKRNIQLSEELEGLTEIYKNKNSQHEKNCV